MKRWLQFYSMKSFLLLENKELSDNPQKVLHQVETFLGIKHFFEKKNLFIGSNAAKGEYNYMSEKTRNIQIDYFRPHG